MAALVTDGKSFYHLCPSCGLPHSNGRRRYCTDCQSIGTALDLLAILQAVALFAVCVMALAWLLY